MRIPVAVLVAFLMFSTDPAAGQDPKPESVPSYRSRLALLPIVFSSPDTRLALGVLPQYIFYTAPGARPSNLRADIYYTWNKQFNMLLMPTIWLPGDAWQISGTFRYRKWPTSYFGIGPGSPDAAKETFTEQLAQGSIEGLRRVGEQTYIGASYDFRWADIRDVEAGGALASGNVPGSGRSRIAGLGLATTFDTREHVYLPRSGALYRIHGQWFAPVFGGDRSFGKVTIDLRQYLHVTGPIVAAIQATMSASTGDIPFRVMPSVGETLRGYETTRYIGRQQWTVRAEVRVVPAWWRLGLAVFGGVGGVADSIGDFGNSRIEAAFGIGIRFLMFPEERITVRQDFAFGRGSSGDYLDINEAF